MATTTVVWKEGMHFCTSTASGKLMCDESSEVGAAYPSAPELLMASLGSCIGSVLVVFATRHDLPVEGMSIDLDWTIAEKPHRIGQIDVAVKLPGPISEKDQRTLTRVAHECLIHNTLSHPPRIGFHLAAGD